MELVGIDRTKVIMLFFVSNPVGQPPLYKMLEGLVQRYKFASVPSKIEELKADRMEFGQGEFSGTRIDLLEVFNDGLVVTSRCSSETIDSFIGDLRQWVLDSFGLKSIETHSINRSYESNLLFTSKKNLFSLLEKLDSVRLSLQKSLKSNLKMDVTYQSFGWGLAPDITTVAGLRPIPFRVERKADVAFSSDLYFSSAPLPTGEHLKLLQLVESLI